MSISSVLKKVLRISHSSWTDIADVEILMPGRGEEIIYREEGCEYQFVVSFERRPFTIILHAGNYWDGTFPMAQKHLTGEERTRILPRLVAYLASKGDLVEVRDA